MRLTPVDWAIIAAYFFFNIGIGLYYKSRAGKNMSEFFLSGRNVPWWLAGTSMVATIFAADTPLVVTGLVARNSIAGNWLWWNNGRERHAHGIPVCAVVAAIRSDNRH